MSLIYNFEIDFSDDDNWELNSQIIDRVFRFFFESPNSKVMRQTIEIMITCYKGGLVLGQLLALIFNNGFLIGQIAINIFSDRYRYIFPQ